MIIIKKRNLQGGGGGISILQEKTPTLPSLSLYIKTNIIITKGTEPTRRRRGFEGFTSRLHSILQNILPNIEFSTLFWHLIPILLNYKINKILIKISQTYNLL